MPTRLCLCLVASWLLAPALVAQAADTHEGKVVSVQEGNGNADGKLVMADKDGQSEHTHMISSNARIMRDNKTVKLSDLKKSDFIKVTTNSDGKVTELAAMQKSTNDQAALPDFLTNLNLTAEQKDKIKNICQQCDGDREAAWQQFEERCREAISIEASMLAAIEDHLTEAQRKHIRNHRQRISRNHNGAARETTNSSKDETASAKNDRAQGNDKNNTIVEEITIIGVTLSPDQETAAENVRGNYFDRLRKLNAETQELHGRLVAMETERLLKIEEVLTKEQRQQLRKDHQKMDRSEKHASTSGGSTK